MLLTLTTHKQHVTHKQQAHDSKLMLLTLTTSDSADSYVGFPKPLNPKLG